MPVIVNKLNAHRNENAVGNLVNYMLRSPFANGSAGRGVCTDSADAVINSFSFTKQMYYKDDRKQVAHLIIESQTEGLVLTDMKEIADGAADYFYHNGFQCFYVIHNGSHDNKRNCHIHLAVNTINFFDGRRLYETYSVTSDFRNAMMQMFPGCKWFSVNDSSTSWE